MVIETLQDYNAQASCCCPQTLCPIPEEVCESRTGTATISGLAPVAPPSGPSNDKISKIFATLTYADGITRYTGTAQRHVIDSFGPTDTREEFIEENFLNWYDALGTTAPYYTGGSYQYTSWIDDVCGSDGFIFTGDPNKGPADVDYTSEDDETCEESQHIVSTVGTSTSGSPLALQGCPGPFTPPGASYYWNFTATTEAGVRLTDGKTEADLIADATADLGSSTGTACAASTSSTWPTIAEIESVSPGGVWPACSENDPPSASANVEVTEATTRWKIPATWNDQVTGAVVPFTGTYFLITYDILDEPDGWDDPTPTVFRSFYAEDQTTLWTGPGSGDADDASWLTAPVILDPPDFPGRRRIVNRRLVCREGWGLGVLPQVWGDAVTLPDP